MTTSEFISSATTLFTSKGISSARLDAIVLLEYSMGIDRAHLLAHPDLVIPKKVLNKAQQCVHERSLHKPVAYIMQQVEFYGRMFGVDERVLVPRPETEELITIVRALPLPDHCTLVDVGTGSGIIGITLKLEMLSIERLWLTDTDVDALNVAQKNAKLFHIEALLHHGDLLSKFPKTIKTHIITANLPYVSSTYSVSKAAKHEPQHAIFAPDNGYHLIEQLIPQASMLLCKNGFLALEMDPWQKDRIITLALKYNFSPYNQALFHVILQKNS